jgi:hypothetical protein
MESTTPIDDFSNADFIRQRWAAMGLDRSEADVQAAAEAMDQEEARCLKQQAQAESPDEDIDDAWQQDRETKHPPEDFASNDFDDTFQSIKDEYWSEVPEPTEEVPTPQPTEAAGLSPEGTSSPAAVRQRGPRRPIASRSMPHGNSTGVWIPREVWEDPRFESTDERILYLEVNHLDKEDGCTATNRHFAEYLGSSTQTIRDMIQDMTARDIFTCSYPNRRSRIIHVVGGRQDYSRHRF